MTGLESVARWSVRWRQVGPEAREHIMYEDGMPVMFRTREEARVWIERTHGYIRRRRDLREAPHHWRMPMPVRVKVVEI